MGGFSEKRLLKRYKAGERGFAQADLTGALLEGSDLREVNLNYSQLSYARLRGVNFSNSTLLRANLSNTDLTYADLSGADLSGADLSGADLSGANLWQAELSDVNLTKVQLTRTDLTHTNIRNANFTDTELEATVLVNCDLQPLFCAKPKKRYVAPIIDYRSIIRTRYATGLTDFLRRCGWPQVFIDYNIECALSLDDRGVWNLLQSTFISYGEPDKLFAKRLSDTLRERGSQTFFFPDHAKPGAPLVEVMYRGVHDNDRVILVCSEASLTRPAVLHETKFALDREARLGGRLLIIPVAIDDYLFECDPGGSMVLGTLRDRVIADFRGALNDEDRFRKQVGRLVSALKKDEAQDVPEGVTP